MGSNESGDISVPFQINASAQLLLETDFVKSVVEILGSILKRHGPCSSVASANDSSQKQFAHMALQIARITSTLIPQIAEKQSSKRNVKMVSHLGQCCAFAAIHASTLFNYDTLKNYPPGQRIRKDRVYLLNALTIARAYLPDKLLTDGTVNILYPH